MSVALSISMLQRSRSMSLPVYILQTNRNIAIGRLNEHRKSVQLILTSTLLSDETLKPKGAGVSFPSSVLMQVAITNGDTHEMHELISEHGVGIVNEREPSGLPPVMRAIFEGQVDSLKFLIEAGANLTACDLEKWNVLHVAAAMDDFEAVEVIMSSLSDVSDLLEAENVCGEKPFHLAGEKEMLQLLGRHDQR